MAVDINKQNKRNVIEGKIKFLLILTIMYVYERLKLGNSIHRSAVVLFSCKSRDIELRRGLDEPY